MSIIVRGAKNSFRNGLRTMGFAVIIAVSMSLAFSMLLANQAVSKRSDQLKKEINTSMIAYPKGSSSDQAAGKPLTDADVDKLAKLAHVRSVTKVFRFAAQKESEQSNDANSKSSFVSGGEDTKPPTISLASSLDPATLNPNIKRTHQPPPLPIGVTGVSGTTDADGKPLNITKGRGLRASDVNAAVIGKELLAKNNLKLGDTFTIKDTTFTIVGMFDIGTAFGNNGVFIPFKTAQKLMDSPDTIQSVVVTSDSLDNLNSVQANVQKALGKDRLDVVLLQQDGVKVIANLASIEAISFTTLIVSLATAALTILLTMLLVVRERTKEIGVLKALGGTNVKIVGQFLVEALVLTAIGAAIGMALALLSSNSILHGLLDSKFATDAAAGSGPIGSSSMRLDAPVQDVQAMVASITTLLDWQFVAYGLGAALVIAIVGTTIPAFLIAKVRPAQIMRGN